jgi:hypothetical protein
MVAITERIAARDWEITAENGDHFAVKAGKQYTTTKHPRADGSVTVFSNFWVPVPIDVFGLPDQTIECPHCHQRFLNTAPT